MKIKKVLCNILFWITLISPMASFCLAGLIGETDIFEVFGIVRYSWIMLLFIPIPVVTLLIANVLRKHNEKYKKHYIVCFICLPLLIIFGSYRFIFHNIVSYESSVFINLENGMKINLPSNIKIATGKIGSYSLGYAKIQDEKEKNEFEQSIIKDNLWESKMSQSVKEVLPIDIQYKLVQFDYFLLYNSTSNEYNTITHEGDNISFIAYSCEDNRFLFLYDFIVR